MRRLVALAAAVLVAATAAPGDAAPTKRPQIVDAPTDSLTSPQGGTEIVSALWTTTGDTTVSKVRGKRVVTYTPRKLVVTLNLAAAPLTNAPFAYETSAEFAGCGEVRFVYAPGTVYSQVVSDTFLWYDCGEYDPATDSSLTLVPGVRRTMGAKSITWEYAIKAFPKSIRAGVAVTGFRAAVDALEPALGLYGTNLARSLDEGTSDAVWKLGS